MYEDNTIIGICWTPAVILFIIVIVTLCTVSWANSQSEIISSTNEIVTVHSTPSLSQVMTDGGIVLNVDKYYCGRLLIDKTYNVTIATRRIGDKWITYCENC